MQKGVENREGEMRAILIQFNFIHEFIHVVPDGLRRSAAA